MIRDFHFVEGIFLHLKRMRDYHKKKKKESQTTYRKEYKVRITSILKPQL